MKLLEVGSAWRFPVCIVESFTDSDLTAYFSDREIASSGPFRSDSRRREWFASRMAARKLAFEQGLAGSPREVAISEEAGRPRFHKREATFLTFTHSRGLGGAAVGDSPVGIDLEQVRPIDDRARKFFLSSAEMEMAADLQIDAPTIHCWSAKEAAWKALRNDNQTGLSKVSLSLESVSGPALEFRYRCGDEQGSVTTLRVGAFVVALANGEDGVR